jgi:hypothetical protein
MYISPRTASIPVPLELERARLFTTMAFTPPPPQRPSLTSRLSAAALAASAVQQIPGSYFSVAKNLLSVAAAHTPLLGASSAKEVIDGDNYFPSVQDGSSSGSPPPKYTTSPPTPEFPRIEPILAPPLVSEPVPLSASLGAVMPPAASSSTAVGCNSCSRLQLQLHLLTLQNEAYMAQRDYLLRNQSLPPPTSAESSGVISFMIASFIRTMFLLAFLLWPYLRQVLGTAREWEKEWQLGVRVRSLGWRCAAVVWAVVARAGGEQHIERRRARAEWEIWATRAMEEVLSGVGQGVREGLGVWGVRMESSM